MFVAGVLFVVEVVGRTAVYSGVRTELNRFFMMQLKGMNIYVMIICQGRDIDIIF